ncbi:MAG: biotin--[acetyl-CoA-carboxylase] ligase [Desulfobacterium sp.]|nr:biotin--[acetyl-CoA-carboxylase] ligase [Desulfobacterium sp.]
MRPVDDDMPNKEMTGWRKCLGGHWDFFELSPGSGISPPLWVSPKDKKRRYLARACTSTMDVAGRLVKQREFPRWSWILAGIQTQGRGQLGRSWISRSGNLFATIRLPQSAGTLGNLLPLALGAVLVEVLAELGLPAEVKWPNDILVGRTKVGGILVEERGGTLFAGIGINVDQGSEAESFSYSFKMPAGSLQSFGVDVSVPCLWMQVEKCLIRRLLEFISCPGRVVAQLGTCLAFKDEPIVVTNAGPRDGPATLVGISTSGGLIIRTARGDHIINRGQVIPPVF